MIMLSFDTLLNLIQAHAVADTLLEQRPASRGMNFHSGRLEQGEIFFALAGAQQHGLRFAEQALAKGASLIISDKAHPQGIVVADPAATLLQLGKYARQQLKKLDIPVIAVTGSVGKTSSKAMLARALEASSSLGNFNTPLALACTLLRHALQGKAKPLVLELGIDHVGEMQQLCELVQPDIALLTSIAPSHLHGLGDIATVAREKTVLIEHAKQAFVSEQAAVYLTAAQRAKSTIYGLSEACQVQGRILETQPSGQIIEVIDVSFQLPYIGKAMATNATGALAVARALALPLPQAAQRLEGVVLEPQRLQVHHFDTSNDGIYLIDDAYNSNPASVREALDSLQHFPRPHRLIVGDMLELGVDSQAYHRQLGQWSKAADTVIAIGQESVVITEENTQALHAPDAEAAIDLLAHVLPKIEKGTVLVKASRGLQLERIVQHLQNVLSQQQVQAVNRNESEHAPSFITVASQLEDDSVITPASQLAVPQLEKTEPLEGQAVPC